MTVVKDHLVKESIVRDYIKRFSIDTFIETGTYEGIMAHAIAPHVKSVLTIELDEKLHEFAKRNLKDKPNVRLFSGDSGEMLLGIMEAFREPCLLWLDAHYSGGITAKGETETPILKELEAILKSPYDHIILIDDARLYTGEGDWPSLDELKAIILKAHPDWVFDVVDDIIRAHPKCDFISMSTLGKFGQFGNQLFQYAAMKYYAKKHNLRLEIPADWPGRKVFIDCDKEAAISQMPREQVMVESDKPLWGLENEINNKELKNCDVKGYLQYHTEWYDKEHFRSLFRFIPDLEDALAILFREVKQQSTTLVAIHIRLGDYKIPSRSRNIAPTQWYLDWLKENWDKLDNPILYIASDEVDKVRDDFRAYNPHTFKDKNFLCDYYILAHSDFLLTSNSTFSFTAAMLNKAEDRDENEFELYSMGRFFRPDFKQKKLKSFDPWDSEPVLKVEQDAIKLHLGCGNQRHEGFINIDCKKTPATDLLCDIRQQLPFEDDSVDEIECYHVFEHFPVCLHANVSKDYGEKYDLLIKVLCEWKRVLKGGGILAIEMPDIDKTFEAYLKADEEEKDRLLIPVYGSYRQGDDTDIHRWGANKHRLTYILEKAGFRNIEFMEATDYHAKDCPCLRVEAIK